MQRMESLLAEALDAGAQGFSTGLMYAPGSSAPLQELERLCAIVARRDKIYTSHIRSYSAGLVAAVEEQIELARRTGCRLQISHLQAVGAANWPQHRRALEAIEAAHGQGVDVEFDCYPYIAGSSMLTQLLPQAALEGGTRAMLARLRDPAVRVSIAQEIDTSLPWRWSDIYIASLGSGDPAAVGQNLAALGESRNCAPVDALLDLLIESEGDANMISFNQSEENLKLSLTHPLATIISDGYYVKGRPHPRLHGTFPLLLGEFSRERGWLPLADAVHKITGKPAQRFRISGRGRIAAGQRADLTVFDPGTIGSPATYETPELAPRGISHVLRNGECL